MIYPDDYYPKPPESPKKLGCLDMLLLCLVLYGILWVLFC